MALNEKQRRFAAEYLIDLNATQAATRAGYSKKTAYSQGQRLLKHAEVQEAIQEGQRARAARTGITQDRVLQELGRVAFSDIRKLFNKDGSLKSPAELDDDTAAAIASMETLEEFSGSGKDREFVGYARKVRTHGKVESLRLAMQHLGMLVEKHQHEHDASDELLALLKGARKQSVESLLDD